MKIVKMKSLRNHVTKKKAKVMPFFWIFIYLKQVKLIIRKIEKHKSNINNKPKKLETSTEET